MADPPAPPEDPIARLAELLQHPEDLDKLSSLKSEFTRKKAAVDAQLKTGLSEQLNITQAGMTSITDAGKTLQAIKDEMAKIDRLCAESQSMIKDFPEINKLSIMQRNFGAVEAMKKAIDSFPEKLEEMQELLGEDDQDLENQPNLLAIHEGLTGLRDVRDDAMEQVKAAEGRGEAESGLEMIENLPLDGGPTLREYFGKLDEIVGWFDEHVLRACETVIGLVQAGNNGLVVRLALVIEEEEKKDRQVRALREAQKEFGDVASRFKSLNLFGQRELREYKGKFSKTIETSAAVQFESVKKSFEEDPERLEKYCRWFFNDLNTVKLGLVELVPKRWRIFKTYTNIYHKLMHDFLVAKLDDPNITPVHMLAILNWVPKYYNKMQRLGINEDELKQPHLIDDREADLVREYRTLITKAVEEWMDRLTANDRKQFRSRDEASLDQDADGCLHTKSLSDMWTMLREQLSVAQASGRTDVVEGVVEAMIRALKARQKFWENLIDAEFRRFEDTATKADSSSSAGAEMEGLSSYQDWLVAIANDQITCIDDDPSTGSIAFLSRFRQDYEPLVSPSFPLTNAGPELESLTNGYIDLASHCMHLFASLLFITDFRGVVRTFFVSPQWYAEKTMRAITTTFEDYLKGENNVLSVLHPSLGSILVEEMADALLIAYLSAVRRNRGVKFRRQDGFSEKIREDVVTVFEFFSSYPEVFTEIKDKWRAVNSFENLISADKNSSINIPGQASNGGVVEAFVRMKQTYWDVQLAWVEAVLRARDDFDRGMLSAVKSAAAAVDVERGAETVMGKVK